MIAYAATATSVAIIVAYVAAVESILKLQQTNGTSEKDTAATQQRRQYSSPSAGMTRFRFLGYDLSRSTHGTRPCLLTAPLAGWMLVSLRQHNQYATLTHTHAVTHRKRDAMCVCVCVFVVETRRDEKRNRQRGTLPIRREKTEARRERIATCEANLGMTGTRNDGMVEWWVGVRMHARLSGSLSLSLQSPAKQRLPFLRRTGWGRF